MSEAPSPAALPDDEFHLPEVSTRTILLGAGPRFARDAFGPMLVFYAGFKLAVVYLAQPVLINGAYGLAFLGSIVIGRPLAGLFATETYPFPDDVKSSDTFRCAFSRVSLAWGLYLVLRSAVRMASLSGDNVDSFLVVNMLTGVPLTAMLMSWSVWYAVRYFRKSEEFGEVIQLLEAGAL